MTGPPEPSAVRWRIAVASLAGAAAVVPTGVVVLAAVLIVGGEESFGESWPALLPWLGSAVVLWLTVGVMLRPGRRSAAVTALLLVGVAVTIAAATVREALPEILDPPLKGGGMATAVGVSGLLATAFVLGIAVGVLVVRSRLPRSG